MLKILQINIGKCHFAHDFTLHTANKEQANVIIVSEQNPNLAVAVRWFADSRRRAAIVVLGNTPIDDIGPQKLEFRWVAINGIRIYSCY